MKKKKLEPLGEKIMKLILGFVDDYEKKYIGKKDFIVGLATHIELEIKDRIKGLFKDIEKLNGPIEDIFITSKEFNKLKKEWGL